MEPARPFNLLLLCPALQRTLVAPLDRLGALDLLLLHLVALLGRPSLLRAARGRAAARAPAMPRVLLCLQATRKLLVVLDGRVRLLVLLLCGGGVWAVLDR
jgi:hypothetical protein